MDQCANCLAMIPYESYELHTLHCSRHIFLCSCGQYISQKAHTDHIRLHHKSAICVFCGQQMETWMKSTHKCEATFVICEVCNLHLSSHDLLEHQKTCKSRTTQCDQCKKYLNHCEMKRHSSENCMPLISEAALIKKPQKKTAKNSKSKKKCWKSVSLTQIKPPRLYISREDLDQLYAEQLLEEIVDTELADEEKKGMFTIF